MGGDVSKTNIENTTDLRNATSQAAFNSIMSAVDAITDSNILATLESDGQAAVDQGIFDFSSGEASTTVDNDVNITSTTSTAITFQNILVNRIKNNITEESL